MSKVSEAMIATAPVNTKSVASIDMVVDAYAKAQKTNNQKDIKNAAAALASFKAGIPLAEAEKLGSTVTGLDAVAAIKQTYDSIVAKTEEKQIEIRAAEVTRVIKNTEAKYAEDAATALIVARIVQVLGMAPAAHSKDPATIALLQTAEAVVAQQADETAKAEAENKAKVEAQAKIDAGKIDAANKAAADKAAAEAAAQKQPVSASEVRRAPMMDINRKDAVAQLKGMLDKDPASVKFTAVKTPSVMSSARRPKPMAMVD